jgi:large subunit ribosomal protein L15
MVNKTKKTKKSKGQRGTNHYHGARKKWKGSGHHGGVGMAGTGKRADTKRSLVIKLYGHKYFGKQGETSKSTERKKTDAINLGDIQKNLDSLIKKHGKGKELDLRNYKILGDGELNEGLKIKAKSFSESAKKKIEKAGGEIIIFKNEEKTSDRKILKKEKIKEKKPTKTKVTK